jgi:hypothetical protein
MSQMKDTLITTGSLTYTIHRSNDTLLVIAKVDSLVVASTRDTSAVARRLAVPVAVELRPIVDSLSTTVVDSMVIPPGCDSMEDAARAIARDLHIRIASGIHPGQQWTDSSSALVCRGGIPMIATTISTFEVQGMQSAGDTTILPIMRRSSLILAGSGMQGSRRIAVTGEGTSETLFRYELAAGALLDGRGESTLRLRFETIQQTEQVSQRSSSRIRLRSRRP